MYTLFVILAVITAILLALVVLIQESKGGGLASNVSGANSVLGVRKTTDFIEKATWILAAALVAFSIACSFFDHTEAADPSEIVTEMGTTAPAPVKVPTAPGASNAAPSTSTPAPAAPASAPAPAK